MKMFVKFGVPFLMLCLASCTKKYTYVETVKQPGLFGGYEIEEKTEVIRAANDSTAFVEAFRRYCISLHVYRYMNEIAEGLNAVPVDFVLYNRKGELVLPVVSLETLNAVADSVFSIPIGETDSEEE